MIVIAVATAALAAVSLARLAVGSSGFGFASDSAIADVRLARVITSAIVGAALALGGAMLQSLLRNPLASPDLLGQSAGAGFAVMLITLIAHALGLSVSNMALAPVAVGGALAALAVVYAAAQRRGMLDPPSLILVGVIVALMCGAGTALVQHLLPPDPSRSHLRWLFGAINDDATWMQIAAVGGVVIAAAVLGATLGPALDAATLPDDEALSMGVRLGSLRITLFITSGILAAGSVLLAGPIGFVGLICPHAVRLTAGPAHRPLMIASALIGAALLVGADLAVAIALAIWPELGRIPVGILTALIGGPVFIAMLRRELRG